MVNTIFHEYACNPENFWPQIREKIADFPTIFHQIQDSGSLVWVDSVDFVSDAPGKNDGSEKLKGGGLSTDALIELVKNAAKKKSFRTSPTRDNPCPTTIEGKFRSRLQLQFPLKQSAKH